VFVCAFVCLSVVFTTFNLVITVILGVGEECR